MTSRSPNRDVCNESCERGNQKGVVIPHVDPLCLKIWTAWEIQLLARRGGEGHSPSLSYHYRTITYWRIEGYCSYHTYWKTAVPPWRLLLSSYHPSRSLACYCCLQWFLCILFNRRSRYGLYHLVVTVHSDTQRALTQYQSTSLQLPKLRALTCQNMQGHHAT